MWKDPIVEEIRAIRRKLSDEFGSDVKSIFEHLRKRDLESNGNYVARSPITGRLEPVEIVEEPDADGNYYRFKNQMPTKLAIHGAAGRMGRRVVDLASQDKQIAIVAALESAGSHFLGQDAGLVAGGEKLGVPLSVVGESAADVVIDFSVPDAGIAIVDHCLQSKKPLVIATTGFEPDQKEFIATAAEQIPIVFAPSMSTAVNLVMKLAEIAGRVLKDYPSGVDVEIIERHHRFKEDAPSGTALKFGEIVAEAMGLTEHVHGREGRTGKRSSQEIGYHAVRTGDNPGEHTIVFGMLGETIELRVAASNRDCYAQGAILAAKWLVGKPPGMYGMKEVLGL